MEDEITFPHEGGVELIAQSCGDQETEQSTTTLKGE